jgi:hypothetical protein
MQRAMWREYANFKANDSNILIDWKVYMNNLSIA